MAIEPRLVWAVAASVLLGTGAAFAAEPVEANLKVVGRTDLGRPGSYGDVTVAGRTAVVAVETPGTACPTSSAEVVDIRDPGRPRVVASIPVPESMVVADVDSVTVDVPGFVGDLVAVAVAPDGPCAGGRPAVVYYDVTDPAAPRLLAETAGGSSVSLSPRGDGRVLAVRASAAGVAVDDVSDPRQPAVIGQWSAPGPAGPACAPAHVQAYDGGEGAVAVLPDGRAFDLDLAEPSRPASAGPAEGGAGHVGVLLLGNRTIALVAEAPGCSGPDPGLRILTLERGVTPREEPPLRYAGAGTPGRFVTSGALAYVAWHAAGVRVVDFGEVRPRTVAQFVPSGADVVGVGLLPEHVVVTDAAQGLFVLERPDEGGGRATFWSQFLSLLPYLAGAMLMAAIFLVPRAIAGRAGAGAPSPAGVPTPARIPRRRA